MYEYAIGIFHWGIYENVFQSIIGFRHRFVDDFPSAGIFRNGKHVSAPHALHFLEFPSAAKLDATADANTGSKKRESHSCRSPCVNHTDPHTKPQNTKRMD